MAMDGEQPATKPTPPATDEKKSTEDKPKVG